MRQRGFTIIELIVGMGIFLTILAISMVNISRLPGSSAKSSGYDLLVADIKSQQTESMMGDLNDGIVHDNYGIYFTVHSYTFFKGDALNPSDPANFTINLDPNISLSDITFKDSMLIFEKGSGEVINYASNQNSLSVKDDQSGEVKLLNINKYGAVYQ